MSALNDLTEDSAGRIVRLPERMHEWFVGQFVDRFVRDPSATWWWTALRVAPTTTAYGESDGLALIEGLALGWGPALLLLTDEEPNPAASFMGLATDVLSVLREGVNFEFVLARLSLDEWVFDTHSNQFLHFRAHDNV